MSDRLAPREVDRMRQAESRWLEQARDRLSRPASRSRASSARPGAEQPEPRPDHEETDR